MKGFALKNGDVVISNNRVVMVEAKELLRQTAESVVGTNKGEWPLNIDEGIRFKNVLGKNITEDMIKHEIQQGLQQVDNTFNITDFSLEHLNNRKYAVKATAQNADGAGIAVNSVFG